MNFNGVIIGAGTFFIIGVLHPVVIKVEYHIGSKAWPVFLIAGLISIGAALFLGGTILPPLLAVLGFSLLWSVRELFEQEKRVERGWFPKNPGRSQR